MSNIEMVTENYQHDSIILQRSGENPGENPECVFWDFEIQDWSRDGCQLERLIRNVTSFQDGCQLQQIIRNHMTCHCDHLTNFAVLVVSICKFILTTRVCKHVVGDSYVIQRF